MGVDFEKKIEKAIGLSALRLLNEVKKETPVNTGNLRNSIRLEKTGNGFIIGTPVDYAEAVELGTKPHIITPVNKKVLKFKVNGRDVFSKKVNHPGTSGHHMFLKASKKFERIFKEELSKLK